MRKYFILLCLLTGSVSGFTQADTIQPPYKRFPFFPPVTLLLPDSATSFTKEDLPKKKSILLIVFSPTCEHCQHETEEMVKNIEKFKEVTIVMATSLPFDSMMNFRAKYGLSQYNNIIMGQDTQFFLPTYYDIHNLPFHAFFDKKGKFISRFDGNMPMDKVLEELGK